MYTVKNDHYAVLIVGGTRDGMIVIDDLTMDEASEYADSLICYDNEVATVYDKSTDVIVEVHI